MFTSGKIWLSTNWGFSTYIAGRWLAIAVCIVAVSSQFNNVSSARELNADRIFAWRFSHEDDRDTNDWPDDWQRRRDLDHPRYLQMRLLARDPDVEKQVDKARKTVIRLLRIWETGRIDPYFIPESTPPWLSRFFDDTVVDKCFEITMNGGSAEVVGPTFPLDPRFSFQLHAELTTEELAGHKAWAELQLLDAEGNLIDTISTATVSGDTPWQRLLSLEESITGAEIAQGRICLKVQPNGALALFGTAKFDNLAVYRLPRLALATNVPMNIAEPGTKIEIACTAMGAVEGIKDVEFELRDINNAIVKSEIAQLVPIVAEADTAHFVATEQAEIPHYVAPASLVRAYNGKATWHFDAPPPGLYEVRVQMDNNEETERHRALMLAVMKPTHGGDAGPFGWSLPEFDDDLRPADIPLFATRFGAGWIKFPIWFDILDTEFADKLVHMTQRLQGLGIACVGRIDQPPEPQWSEFESNGDRFYAASIFREPEIWEPLLEPVLTRLGMRLTWFQLGADDDLSFMGAEGLPEYLQQVRDTMQSYCQELKINLTWDWLEVEPLDDDAPWDSVQFSTNKTFTANELHEYLKATEEAKNDTWITFNPLPRSEYSTEVRVRDFAERLVEIKRSPIKAAFLSNPFDPEKGLFEQDGSVGEMLIPWTQLVKNFGGASYVGAIQMPQGSINHVFERESQGVMLLWNDETVEENQFLGKSITAEDVWGSPVEIKNVTAESGATEQSFKVGKWPVIVHGVDLDIVRWRLRFKVNIANLESRSGAKQSLPITLENPFQNSVASKINLASESMLKGGKAETRFQIAGRKEETRKFPIQIRSDASAGLHELRFDFDIDADESYQFSIYRSVTLGLNDIQIQWDVARISPTQVQLRMDMENNTDAPVSFDCKLFPVRPYVRFQIQDAPTGNVYKEFTLNIPQTPEPIEYWLRCEGIGSNRILNYRIVF